MVKFQARSVSGESFSNDTLKGKVVLIQYWATWCKFCRKDEPALERVISDHANDGLVVLAVNAGEPPADVRNYLKDHPRTASVVLSKDTNLASVFEGAGLPAYILLDRDGSVAGTQSGSGGILALRELLKDAGLGK